MKTKWPTVALGEVLEADSRPVSLTPATPYREIGIRSHGRGVFHKPPVIGAVLGGKAVFEVVPDRLVFNIVFAWEGAVALTGPREAGCIASHRFPQYAVDRTKVLPEFLLEYLLTPRGLTLMQLASPGGAGRNRTLGRGELLRSTMALPGLALQRGIVRSLQALEHHAAAVGATLEGASQLKRALMQRLLSRRCAPGSTNLGSLVEINPSAVSPTDELVPFVGMADVDEFGAISRVTLRERSAVVGGASAFRNLDVLVAKITPCFENGKGALVDGLTTSVAYGSTEFHVLRARSALNPRYLAQLTRSPEFRKRGIASMTGSAGQKRVPRQFIENYRLELPSVSSQHEAVIALETIDKACRQLTEFLAALRLQKRGVMQKLLAGDIDLPAGTHALDSPTLEAEQP